jgi:mannose-6-phosphate isomerase-like protein (cupin superfamily)
MDIKAYISSGIIEDYCLGVLPAPAMKQVEEQAALHPAIQEEITAFQQVLEQYSCDFAQTGSYHPSKEKILGVLDNLLIEEKADAANLPILNKYADSRYWLSAVKPLLPAQLEEPLLVHVLKNTPEVELLLMWTKIDYPDEVHANEKECFLILEGECECYIDEKVIRLSAGGFLDIPMHAHHDVKVIKGPVLAVVQRLKIAS